MYTTVIESDSGSCKSVET